jgi:cytochrome c oxidase subunit 3
LLLSRGVSVTLFHRFLFQGNGGLVYLIYTIFLGVFFEICQINEYRKRVLCLASFTYGTVFFMLTGLHGFHVFVGLVCLLILFYFIFFSYINSLSLIRRECLI